MRIETATINKVADKLDANTYAIPSNTLVLIDFGRLKFNGLPVLLMQAGALKSPIYLQSMDEKGSWTTFNTIWTRSDNDIFASKIPNWLPNSNGYYLIRLLSPNVIDLDYVAVETNPKLSYVAIECTLLTANHSRLGDIFASISSPDNAHIELRPGEFINLTYGINKTSLGKIDYILYIKGYYTTP